MAPVKANTWPPLISGESTDDIGNHQLYGAEVLGSFLFEADPGDGFFYPVEGGLSGYAYDGSLYQNGAAIHEASKASWYLENPGPFRGERAEFPQRGIILLTDAGVSIIDLDNQWRMWMLFLRGDALAFTHNALGSISGFKPTGVTYASGRVLIALTPDRGSDFKSAVTLVFDFTSDTIYMERPAYRAPIPGPYARPVMTVKVGYAAAPNAPTLDLVEGGAPTYWNVYPQLPAGLSFNEDTGEITGTPEVPSALTTYIVSAYNPGGVGQTSVDVLVKEGGSDFESRWMHRSFVSSTWYMPR